MTKEFDDDGSEVLHRDLTDKQERYCQLRAQGFTKTKAASIAFEGSGRKDAHLGWQAEQNPRVKDRIRELQEERAEAFGLTPEEQIRKYHEIYQEAVSTGKYALAIKVLERLDAIGGFVTSKSESTTKKIDLTKGGALKDGDGDIKGDIDKFSTILGSHGEKPH